MMTVRRAVYRLHGTLLLLALVGGVSLAVPPAYAAGADAASADAASADAAPSDATAGEEETSVLSNVRSMVDGAQAGAEQQFLGWVESIDEFFGSGQQYNGINESWARLRIDAVKPGDDSAKLRGTVKLKLVLPRAEQRFRLLFSTEDDDSTEESTSSRQALDNEVSQNASLALRFIRTARRSGSLNFDIGARVLDGKAQWFGRINASIEDDIGKHWVYRVSNNLYHFSESGYDDRLQVDFRRSLYTPKSVFFRTSTLFNWVKDDKGAAIGETAGIYGRINDRMSIALEGLASYTTALNGEETDRYKGSEIRIRFRHNVWREWFFYEIWPGVNWLAANDYEKAYGGLIRAEVVLGQL